MACPSTEAGARIHRRCQYDCKMAEECRINTSLDILIREAKNEYELKSDLRLDFRAPTAQNENLAIALSNFPWPFRIKICLGATGADAQECRWRIRSGRF